jgi:predicted small lipoprotein YifL
VNKSRRSEFRQALAIVMIAGALAACGVKGELEAPSVAASAAPVASAAEQKSKAQGSQAQPKVFTEESAVRRAASPTLIPSMPPEEWSKGRNTQPATQQKSRDKTKPDEPFFLDKLL